MAVAGTRPQNPKNRSLCVRQTHTNSIQKTEETAETIRHTTVLFRRFDLLCQISAERPAYCRKGQHSTHRTQKSYFTYTYQTTCSQDYLFFQIRNNARYCYWTRHQHFRFWSLFWFLFSRFPYMTCLWTLGIAHIQNWILWRRDHQTSAMWYHYHKSYPLLL